MKGKTQNADSKLTWKQPSLSVVGETDLLAVGGDDQSRLIQLENIIRKGLSMTFEIGAALREIRDSKLFRPLGFSTFEDYCRARWDIERSTAYQYIQAAEVRKNLSATADILPENEAQTRPLAKLEPAEQKRVWKQVLRRAPKEDCGRPKVTERLVRQVVDEIASDDSDEEDDEVDDEWDVEDELAELLDKLEETWAEWPPESRLQLLKALQLFVREAEEGMTDQFEDRRPAREIVVAEDRQVLIEAPA